MQIEKKLVKDTTYTVRKRLQALPAPANTQSEVYVARQGRRIVGVSTVHHNNAPTQRQLVAVVQGTTDEAVEGLYEFIKSDKSYLKRAVKLIRA